MSLPTPGAPIAPDPAAAGDPAGAPEAPHEGTAGDAPGSAPEDEDDRLMRRYAEGDASAFEALYRRHEAGLYRFLRRLLGSAEPAQVDEVFQDSWMRVIGAAGRWQAGPARFRTWLYTLAQHRAIDCLRRSGREGPAEGAAGGAPDDGGNDGPWEPAGQAWGGWPAAGGGSAATAEDRAFWRAAGRRLLDCLDTLPPEQRSVFLLHHEEELSLAELAAAIGIGFETTRSRLRYAMARLRACMGAYLPAPERP